MKRPWIRWPRNKKSKSPTSTNDECSPELVTAKAEADHLTVRLRELRVRRSTSPQKEAL